MTEYIPAFAAGIAMGLGLPLGRRLFRRSPGYSQNPEFDGWEQDSQVAEPHEHIGHIAGTAMRGGVKHKRMQCSLCPKRWSEPC